MKSSDMHAGQGLSKHFNTLRPRQNGRHFPDDIFLNENVKISIKISLKFVPKGPINYITTLVQIMAWRRPGDNPLSEPMMVSLLTHMCVTRPHWGRTDDILEYICSIKTFGIFTHISPTSFFLRVKLIICQRGSGHGLVPNRQQAIIWINYDLVYWRIYMRYSA